MKNETIKNEEANFSEALQQNSLQSSQQELPPLDNARRIQAVEDLPSWATFIPSRVDYS